MKMKAERKKIGWVLLAGLACGAIVWALSVPLTGMREPWDSPGYYYIVAVFIAGILAALPAPRYWWAAVVGVFLGERIYAFVMLPETRYWLLFRHGCAHAYLVTDDRRCVDRICRQLVAIPAPAPARKRLNAPLR